MKLYSHQELVLKESKDNNKVAYYLDMGLGKTFVGSEKATQFNKTILLICQKSKINDWLNHFTSYYDFNVYDLTKKKEYEEFFTNINKSIGIINYELTWRRPELLKLNDIVLMLDESSIIQNDTTKQAKFILKLGIKNSNVILLSGTPCSGKYENLWSQAKLLGWDISKRDYERQYVRYETLTDKYGRVVYNPTTHKPINIVSGYKNEELLKSNLRNHGAIFLKTEEVFNLPGQIFTDCIVEVTSQYKEFIKLSIISIDGDDLIGNTTLTKLLYSRMLCGHYNNHKLNALHDLLLSTNERLVIFYNFKVELKAIINICEKLNRPYSRVDGDIKSLDQYEKQTNAVALCQYQAASKGLNLQLANRIIYFTPTLSVENYMQSQKRIHRIGQNNTCYYYRLICKGSVEEKIYKALELGIDYTNKLFEEDY